MTFIELGDELYPNDLHVLDVLIRTPPKRVRLFRTSAGFKGPTSVNSGNLTATDFNLPLPLIVPLDGFDGTGWSNPGTDSWQDLDPVAHWADVLGASDGKGNSQQGMVSRDGTLFVQTRRMSAMDENGPRWNGLSKVAGTATPARAFPGTAGELFSSIVPHQAAGPEGMAVATTTTGDTFVFATNYDGVQAAGSLHVQVITDPGNVDLAESYDVDFYEMLGDYLDANFNPSGLYGPEVPRHWFDSPIPGPSAGDKLRGAHVFVVKNDPEAFPNAGKSFLTVLLDLDPVWPPFYEHFADTDPDQPGWQPGEFDPAYDYQPLDGSSWKDGPGGTRDDGKYDYVAFTDLTDLWAEPQSGGGATGRGITSGGGGTTPS